MIFMINDLEANRIMNGERGLPASMAVREALMPDYDKHHQKVLRILELAEANSSPAGPMAPVDTKVFCELLPGPWRKIYSMEDCRPQKHMMF